MRFLRAIQIGLFVSAFTIVLTAPMAGAQTATDVPEADPADVESIDAITKAVYDVISGEKGEERNWDRFRSLFHADARLIPTQRNGSAIRASAMTPEDYIERAGPSLVANGFFEREIYRKTEQFGSIAHHFSTYESFRSAADTEPFMRGINSFQLVHDGSRWWIVTIFWQAESSNLPIPDQYLGM